MPPDPVLAEPVDVGSFVVDGGVVVALPSAVDVAVVVVGPVVVVVDAPAVVDV